MKYADSPRSTAYLSVLGKAECHNIFRSPPPTHAMLRLASIHQKKNTRTQSLCYHFTTAFSAGALAWLARLTKQAFAIALQPS